MAGLTVYVAFAAGILSFVSPCTLPLFPSYLGYISGVSFRDKGPHARLGRRPRIQALAHAFCFCIGLSFLFIVLGWGATAVGQILLEYKSLVREVGGALIIVMGLVMTGVLRSEWLLQERKLQLPTRKPLGYFGSVLVGVAFAAGWTPCVGPILASVLAMVAADPTQGTWLMAFYALGFSIPFLILALTLASIRPLLKYTERIARVGGWLLVLMGLLLLTNKMVWITIYLQKITHYQGV